MTRSHRARNPACFVLMTATLVSGGCGVISGLQPPPPEVTTPVGRLRILKAATTDMRIINNVQVPNGKVAVAVMVEDLGAGGESGSPTIELTMPRVVSFSRFCPQSIYAETPTEARVPCAPPVSFSSAGIAACASSWQRAPAS